MVGALAGVVLRAVFHAGVCNCTIHTCIPAALGWTLVRELASCVGKSVKALSAQRSNTRLPPIAVGVTICFEGGGYWRGFIKTRRVVRKILHGLAGPNRVGSNPHKTP